MHIRIPLEIRNMDLVPDQEERIRKIFIMLCDRVEKEAEIEFGHKAGSLSLKIDSEV